MSNLSPKVTHGATRREALARLQQVSPDAPREGLRRTVGKDTARASSASAHLVG